jgi:hypothetical protein
MYDVANFLKAFFDLFGSEITCDYDVVSGTISIEGFTVEQLGTVRSRGSFITASGHSDGILGNAYNLISNDFGGTTYFNPPYWDIDNIERSKFDGPAWDMGLSTMNRYDAIQAASGVYVRYWIGELGYRLAAMEDSSTGINTYLGLEVFDLYKKTWDKFFSATEEKLEDIEDDIESLHQQIIVLDRGVDNHRH